MHSPGAGHPLRVAEVTDDAVLADVFVLGDAKPQGSMKAPAAGVVIHSDGPGLENWRVAVYAKVLEDFRRRQGFGTVKVDQVVSVSIRTVFLRPKSVASSTVWKGTKPDADKLTRAVLDALTWAILKDDARVAQLYVDKVFGDTPGARILVKRLEQPE